MNLIARLLALEARRPPDSGDTGARERLLAKLAEIAARRAAAGETPTGPAPSIDELRRMLAERMREARG